MAKWHRSLSDIYKVIMMLWADFHWCISAGINNICRCGKVVLSSAFCKEIVPTKGTNYYYCVTLHISVYAFKILLMCSSDNQPSGSKVSSPM